MKLHTHIIYTTMAATAVAAGLFGQSLTMPFQANDSIGGLYSAALPSSAVRSSGTVHVAWEDGRDDQKAIYYRRGTSFGTVWSASDLRLSAAQVGTIIENSVRPQLACGGDTVVVVWASSVVADPNQEHVWASVSSDDGLNWSAPVKITTMPQQALVDLAVDVNPTTEVVVAAWVAHSSGSDGVYYSRYGGSTWSTPAGLGVGDVAEPCVLLTPNAGFVAWIDRSGADKVRAAPTKDDFLTSPLPTENVGAMSVGGLGILSLQCASSSDASAMLTWFDNQACLRANAVTIDMAGNITFPTSSVSVGSVCAVALNSFISYSLSESGVGGYAVAFDRYLTTITNNPHPEPPTITLTGSVYFSRWNGSSWGAEEWVGDTPTIEGYQPYVARNTPLPDVSVSSDGADHAVAWRRRDPTNFDDAYTLRMSWTTGSGWLTEQVVTQQPTSAGATVGEANPSLLARSGEFALIWDDRRYWTTPPLLPSGSPYTTLTPVGAPAVFHVKVTP